MKEEEKRVQRCVPEEKRLCSSLSERAHVEANTTHRAGFDVLVTYQMATGHELWRGVAYRTSGKDRGVMINFCPFCGADFRPAHNGIEVRRGEDA